MARIAVQSLAASGRCTAVIVTERFAHLLKPNEYRKFSGRPPTHERQLLVDYNWALVPNLFMDSKNMIVAGYVVRFEKLGANAPGSDIASLKTFITIFAGHIGAEAAGS
ncbi:hypothetical protein [Afifella marina]|uniref:hypothetical protein n=1 Tax=Afifella marina TaxID=1080 RepID=UPI001113CB24|nr:hypothetical protein [Afifella marina]